MSSELTLHTGMMGDETRIHVSWFDHNNCRRMTDIQIIIEPFDKPRTLTILIDKKVVWQEEGIR